MGLKVRGLGELMKRLSNDAERSSRGAREALIEGGEKIAQRARDYAPVDEANLEDAIVSKKVRDPSRIAVDVYIDESHEGTRAPTVGDYAIRMHEGQYDLGPKSEAKNAGRGKGKVGPKFLENAFLELEPEVRREVEAGLKKGIGH